MYCMIGVLLVHTKLWDWLAIISWDCRVEGHLRVLRYGEEALNQESHHWKKKKKKFFFPFSCRCSTKKEWVFSSHGIMDYGFAPSADRCGDMSGWAEWQKRPDLDMELTVGTKLFRESQFGYLEGCRSVSIRRWYWVWIGNILLACRRHWHWLVHHCSGLVEGAPMVETTEYWIFGGVTYDIQLAGTRPAWLIK